MRASRLVGPLAGALLAVAFAGPVPPGAGAASQGPSVFEADRMAQEPPGTKRDKALREWAREATLPELIFVLRNAPERLGPAEADLVEAALARTSDARADLRRSLRVRMALADPKAAKKVLGELGGDAGALAARSRATPYRIAALLPRRGSYASYADALLVGMRAALAYHNARGPLPLTLDVWPTGDDDPARAAAAMDSASRVSVVMVGELLSVPSLAIATGARMTGIPVLSPTATDESIGAAGPTVFQVGPSGHQRGVALARSWKETGLRIAMVVSSEKDDKAFPTGFASEAERAGGAIVWRDDYAPGSLDFRSTVKRLSVENIGVVLWDGDPREAAALLQELDRQKVKVRLCGTRALAPENFHESTRPLLEGVRYVADDWVLEQRLSAPLDSLVKAAGGAEVNSLHVRGFLAAHLLAEVVRGRALCAEEITASIATRVLGDEYLRERGFLDWKAEGASLPVYEVKAGAPVVLP
jgi:ABC-type branched-subunit amino acid transport system substrate-binding protein